MPYQSTLTDFELDGLNYKKNLADGHAYQDLGDVFNPIINELKYSWQESCATPITIMERRFRDAFARLAGSNEMVNIPFKICPTASNSIDIVAAVLANFKLDVRLIEPTFDNISAILNRRGVCVNAISEESFYQSENIEASLDSNPCKALFLVTPNNPTGHIIDKQAMDSIAHYCAENGIILILDNSFRFHNRNSYDDYAILKSSGVSFLAIEDTGKIWPTQDIKASLLLCSPDLEQIVKEIYNELYLCVSNFALAILEKFILRTSIVGIDRAIWNLVDKHRFLIRRAIGGTRLVVDPVAKLSRIGVEWLNCSGTGLDDLGTYRTLRSVGLTVLPGRHFFWSSHSQKNNRSNIRISLMRRKDVFIESMKTLRVFDSDRTYEPDMRIVS